MKRKGNQDENFVRRNLRNKRGVGKKKASTQTSTVNGGQESSFQSGTGAVTETHGLASIGLDPLMMSLDAAMQPRIDTGLKGSTTRPMKEGGSKSSTINIPRGLGPPKPTGRSVTNKSGLSRLSEATYVKFAPLCPGHRAQSRLLVVKKAGPNRGRKFYGCMFAKDESCNFFMWADDNPALISAVVAECGDSSASETYEDYLIQRFKNKISELTVPELKALMKRLNVRLSFSTQPLRRVTLSGGKNEIIAKIMKEEEFLLTEVFPASVASIPLVDEKASVMLESDEDAISLSDSDDEKEYCVSLGGADSSDAETIPHLVPVATSTSPSIEIDMCERVTEVLHKCFGFDSLRASQSWAIERCTQGLNSLVIMPTGAGKSLCYQIPALLLEGITIVVSPLIALMHDQMKKLPACLPAACLSGGLTAQETATLLVDLKRGFIKVLFVSPERMCTHSFRQLMKDLRSSPLRTHRISLLCVDEAHCMSSWSYNFRPSFLRIRREIAHMNPHSILALTATAPPYIQSDILRHLNIPSDGLNSTRYKRDNLKLHASVPLNDEHKRRMVIDIFKKSADVSDGIKDEAKMPSILYVWRRADADSYCDFLKSHGLKALSYHAGMDTEARRKVQEQFDRGAVDIITATTSFGMGVDKADVRRVVHCGLPKSIEAYLQETGRAGRDNDPAECHLLLTPDDFLTHAALSHSARLSFAQIYLLLKRCLAVDTRDSVPHVMLQTSHVINLEEIERALDIPAVMVETILSQLELPPFNLLRIDNLCLDVVKGSLLPAKLPDDLLIQSILKLNRIKSDSRTLNGQVSQNDNNSDWSRGYGMYFESSVQSSYLVEFEASVFELSRSLHSERDIVTRSLYSLQKTGAIREYKLQGQSIYLTQGEEISQSPNNNSFNTMDEYLLWLWDTSAVLFEHLHKIEELESKRIEHVWRLIYAISSCAKITVDDYDMQRDLANFLSDYMADGSPTKPCNESPIVEAFAKDDLFPSTYRTNLKPDSATLDALRRDISMLLSDPRFKEFVQIQLKAFYRILPTAKQHHSSEVRDVSVTFRSTYICRILQGLGSPLFALSAWKDNSAWGRYRMLEFNSLLELVKCDVSSRAT